LEVTDNVARSALENKAKERGRYIAATTALRDAEAEAIAYSELGFSEAGIAKKIDSTTSTVGEYLDRAVAQYGPEIAHARADFDAERDFEEVTAEEISSWPTHYRETWRDAVDRHPDRAPEAATPDLSGEVSTP
jgi:hypothetical protein